MTDSAELGAKATARHSHELEQDIVEGLWIVWCATCGEMPNRPWDAATRTYLASPHIEQAEATEARLRAALERIAEHGCDASLWFSENPPVPDRCLDPDYNEDGPPYCRCGPCEARAALLRDGEATK